MRSSVLGVLVLAVPAVAQPSATYRLTFDATWSAETHPLDFPPDPHFSALVGAVHADGVSLWTLGTLASPGIEAMAETGATQPLVGEVNALIEAGQAEAVLLGGSVPVSPGSTALEFSLSTAHPRVSLVTMIAPSPDWFVGVDGLRLYEDGAWVASRVVDLYALDAGTDSGLTYTAPDADTQPRGPITRIEGYAFVVDGELRPLGTFTFTRTSPAAGEEAPVADGRILGPPVPNPTHTSAALTLRVPTTGPVRVEAFNALGRRVAVLHDGSLAAGAAHTLTFDAAAVPAGPYVIRATGPGFVAARRVAVVR